MRKKGLLAAAAVAAVLAGMAAARADTVVYSASKNSDNYANNQIGFTACCGYEPGNVVTGTFGVGNTITLAGSGPYFLSTVDLFGYAGGGSLPIEVTLYAGSNPNAGTLLGAEAATPTGNGWTTEVLNFGHLLVPQTLTYIVSIVGNNGSYDDSFVNWQQFTGISGSPAVGASGDMWYGSPGGFVADNNYAIATGAATNTLAVQFSASSVPEASTWAMLGLGFAALGFAGYRKARTPRMVAL